MSFKIVDGDLLKSNAKFIVHQINCVSNNSAGLAYYLFDKYPWANVYKEREQNKTFHIPGQIYVRGDKDNRLVINAAGQFLPGKPSSVLINGINVEETQEMRQAYFLECMSRIMGISDLESIAFPYKIGCGIAGGNWDFYHKVIKSFSKKLSQNVEVTIVKRPEDD